MYSHIKLLSHETRYDHDDSKKGYTILVFMCLTPEKVFQMKAEELNTYVISRIWQLLLQHRKNDEITLCNTNQNMFEFYLNISSRKRVRICRVVISSSHSWAFTEKIKNFLPSVFLTSHFLTWHIAHYCFAEKISVAEVSPSLHKNWSRKGKIDAKVPVMLTKKLLHIARQYEQTTTSTSLHQCSN